MILSIESSCDDSSISITQIETNKLIYHKKISQE
ncbi:MAG: tRNA (adenosine(37)-N6)-threonylcarbamoyltransferase complex transferase subunit TsaD, partial [Campylobacterales bacterium]|nr:tRNA (adenosine(37)-N6)-threonylcarbamoyltransferase complex transferase subunit TsaD [Campylobacterales bacterium]